MAKATVIIEDSVQNIETVKEIKVEKGKFYSFESNGKSKYLKKGKKYTLSAEIYQYFIKKGLGK